MNVAKAIDQRENKKCENINSLFNMVRGGERGLFIKFSKNKNKNNFIRKNLEKNINYTSIVNLR